MRAETALATRSLPTTVADLMRRNVVTISPSASIRELVNLLRQNSISGVPVVEAEHNVVGTVSVSDLMWLSDWLEAGATSDRASATEHLEERTVRDVMTPDVFGVEPEASLTELARFFSRTGLGRAVVLDQGELVGIVSAIDLLGLIADHAPEERA
jgi:CBS domain-containing protein